MKRLVIDPASYLEQYLASGHLWNLCACEMPAEAAEVAAK